MKSKSVRNSPNVPKKGKQETVRPFLNGDAAAAVVAVSEHYTISENAATKMLVLKSWPQLQQQIQSEQRAAS